MDLVDLFLVMIASLRDGGVHQQVNKQVSSEHQSSEGLQSAKHNISGSIKDA